MYPSLKIIGNEYNDNASSFASSCGFIAAVYMEEGYTEGTYIYVGEGCGVGDWNYYSCGCGGKNDRVNAVWREWLANNTC